MNRINSNFLHIWWENTLKWCALVFTILTTILTFISLDEIYQLKSTCEKVALIIGILIVVGLLAFIITKAKSHKELWSKGKGIINVQYGDLFNIKSRSERKLVVIPVNTYFDTIVDNPGGGIFPIVSPNTIHGRWIKYILRKNNITKNSLQQAIYDDLDRRNVHYEPIKRSRGSNRNYPVGSCALYSMKDTDYILLALSTFDNHNKAHSSKDDLIQSVKSLLEFIDDKSQGFECFVPLMGAGVSRTGLTHEEALKVIADTMLLYTDKIHSQINIVIYDGDSSKVSIYDAK